MGTDGNSVLRYMAILAAARDFGVPREELERAALMVDPRRATPRALANVLADALALQRGRS